MADLKFVTIRTFTKQYPSSEPEFRNVSLAYAGNNIANEVVLLGNLVHGTKIIVNQQLVDDLQKIVDYLKSKEK